MCAIGQHARRTVELGKKSNVIVEGWFGMRTIRALRSLRRHHQRRILRKVLHIMLMRFRRVGRRVKVLKEELEIRVEIELGF